MAPDRTLVVDPDLPGGVVDQPAVEPQLEAELRWGLEKERDRAVVRSLPVALVDVVGQLQLDVLKARLDAEYGLPVDFEQSEFQLARWISSDDSKKLDAFVAANGSGVADDV